MELRVIILTVACFSSLVPPAFGTGILAAKALATAGAVKGAAILGGALAAKGALIAKGALLAKGAAAIAAKGDVLEGAAHLAKGVVANGAALIAAKVAAVRGAVTLAAKGAALGGALLTAKAPPVVEVHKPLIVRPQFAPAIYAAPPPPPPLPTLSDKLAALTTLWSTVQSSIEKKTNAVGDLLDALREKVEKPKPVPAVIYDVYYQRQPVVYELPVQQVLDC